MSYENFVRVKVVTPVTNVATSFAILDAVAPQKLPPTDGGYLVLCDSPGNPSWIEVIQYTSRSGLGISGVTRGVEGTTPVAWTGNVYAFQALMAGEANLIQTTLAGKQAEIAPGTTAQYWRGDKTWRDFMTDVRAATLTGLSTSTNAVITATDTVLSGLGKLQKQISDAATNLAANVRAVALTGYVLGSNTALAATDTVLAAFGKVQAQINAKANAADAALTGVPTAPTAALGTNTTQIANMAALQAAIANLLDSAPGALDTLNELAAAMGDDPNFAATMTNALAGKEPSITADLVSKFYSGTKTWRDLPTDVRAVVLTGLSVASGAAVVAGDTLLVAIGKLQKQCTDRLLLAGGTMTGAINEAPIATLASAATVNIGAAAANTILITGTTGITSLGTAASGVVRKLLFAANPVLTYSANLNLPAQINYTPNSGDFLEFTSQGAGVWYCSDHYMIDGQPIRPVNVAHGGTGGTDQASARTGLGLGNVATLTASTSGVANTVVQRDSAGNVTGVVVYASSQLNSQSSIEVGNTGGSASTPFIDFHSGATAVDYDTRILSDTPTGAVGGGVMRYYANGGHLFTGEVTALQPVNGADLVGGSFASDYGRKAAFFTNIVKGVGSEYTPIVKAKGTWNAGPNPGGSWTMSQGMLTNGGNNMAWSTVYCDSVGNNKSMSFDQTGLLTAPALTLSGRATAAEAMLAGTLWTGNGASWFADNGNSYGSVWGGFLSTYLANYFLQIGNLLSQIAAQSAGGGVGSYTFGKNISGATQGTGVLFSGTSLHYSDSAGNDFGAVAGVWRSMGATAHLASGIFLRIS